MTTIMITICLLILFVVLIYISYIMKKLGITDKEIIGYYIVKRNNNKGE